MDNQSLLQHWQRLRGQSLGPSDWLEIDQSRIDAFADTTLDHQDIHVDPQAEATKKIGGTIAHGYLTLSLLSYMINSLIEGHYDDRAVLNYGLNRVRFLHPVPANSRIRLHCTIKSVEAKTNGILAALENTVEIEGRDKPAMVAEKLILILHK